MKRTIYYVVLLFFIFLQGARGQSFKKYAGEFLYIGAGSRVTALGGAGTASTSDVNAAYWNPAGLVEARGFQFEFMHSKQFISSIQQNYLGLSTEYRDEQVLALSLLYLTVNGIKDSRQAFNAADRKVDYSKVTSFNTGDYTLLLSYANSYRKNISYGLNIKAIYRGYHVASAFGLGFDTGMKYFVNDRFALGLMLRDITTTMLVWTTGEKELIAPSIRFGTSYKLNISSLNLTVMPAMDMAVLFENRRYASQLHLGPISLDSFWGLEVGYHHLLALRVGMDELQRFNTGIGVSIPKITFDYSFTAYQSELGNIHRISFHLQFDRLF